MKSTTLVVFIVFVVVGLVSSPPQIESRVVVESTKPPCTKIDLTGCWPELFDGTKPSAQCCGTLKAQQPCYCDFIKNPDLKKFATSREAHLALGFCGIPYPTC
ncbi:unnamed protein product [Brassica rapa]|uniref:Bifunctional inhibitor/plant lipid transfer protein/seed storage helical domain-containing protein n=1 Tax=Brassica campestris TaxID=3711 RepID=A0A8D9H9R3_BRACM|nr:unnamed protein product [Brassica rapa]